jgi:membrane protease YdiL (CAAX protease family)
VVADPYAPSYGPDSSHGAAGFRGSLDGRQYRDRMDGVDVTPTPRADPVRWGISDAAVTWIVSIAAAAFALAPFVEGDGVPRRDEAVAALVTLVIQSAAVVGVLAFVARSKGRGSLAIDFGLRLRLRDAHWVVGGLAIAGVASLFTAPILDAGDINERSQDVKRIFDQANGLELGLLVVAILVIGPISEELLFRGALLRSLQRRTTTAWAVWVSALAFALVHVVLDIGSGFGVPALLFLGLISAWRAAQTRSLSQSICLHAGFNLLVVLGRLVDS